MVDMLAFYRHYFLKNETFATEEFVDAQQPELRPLLQLVTETQMFNVRYFY